MNSECRPSARHLSMSKSMHWHIDWFLEHADVIEVIRIESKNRIECEVSNIVAGMSDSVPMKGFGSSDCTACEAHLYHFRNDPTGMIRRAVTSCRSSSGHTRTRGSR